MDNLLIEMIEELEKADNKCPEYLARVSSFRERLTPKTDIDYRIIEKDVQKLAFKKHIKGVKRKKRKSVVTDLSDHRKRQKEKRKAKLLKVWEKHIG